MQAFVRLLGIIVLFTLAGSALAAETHSYTIHSYTITVHGAQQGVFKGELALHGGQKTAGDRSALLAVSYEVESPRDASTGLPVGKPRFKPVIVTKRVGPSSPQYFRAATAGEVLKTVLIEVLMIDQKGMMALFYTIKLTNASIASVQSRVTPPVSGGQASSQTANDFLETISFTYQGIELQSPPGNTMAAGNWN